jgi:hypothetical protein
MTKKKCIVVGCEGVYNSRGYCKKHYMQINRHGKITQKELNRRCEIDGCENPYHAKGLCNKHYLVEFNFINKIVNIKFKKNG